MGINKDQVKGRASEITGTVKETVGRILGNDQLEADGSVEKSMGAIQKAFGDVKESIKKSVKSA